MSENPPGNVDSVELRVLKLTLFERRLQLENLLFRLSAEIGFLEGEAERGEIKAEDFIVQQKGSAEKDLADVLLLLEELRGKVARF